MCRKGKWIGKVGKGLEDQARTSKKRKMERKTEKMEIERKKESESIQK